MTIKDQLTQERDNWKKLEEIGGHRLGTYLIHEFVLRNGRHYPGQSLPSNVKPGPIKQCFFNARKIVLAKRYKGKFRYCEGFARARDFSFLFHHAWAITEWAEVVETTLRNPHNYDYYGVWFDQGLITGGTGWEAVLASEVHYNVDFMCRFDKGFEAVVDQVFSKPKLAVVK